MLISTFEVTDDGSRTLRLGQGDGTSEAMHSLKGAFSETDYIYGTAIRTALERSLPLSVLSMGLGLGYVEILAAALWRRSGAAGTLRGESFEIVPELREYFLAWMSEREVPTDFKITYDDILDRTATEFAVDRAQIKSDLQNAIERGEWLIREALDSETQFTHQFSAICFDAFSSKSTPDLWSEEFLNAFFAKTASDNCVLSTYACTGALKRALKAQGFTVTIRQGFSSKRDSTFAVKN
ncbi:MAG: MnmC family methyltransferase [Bdellovibrionota bacterium]